MTTSPGSFQLPSHPAPSGEKEIISVPVFIKLLALAFGENPDDLGLKFHRTRLTAFLEKYGLKPSK